MVSGVVMFDTWFLPESKTKAGREELIDHMGRLLHYGMRLSNDAPTPKTARAKKRDNGAKAIAE